MRLQYGRMEEVMILADKIMNLRKKNGWSQEELAEKLGVTRSPYQNTKARRQSGS